MKVLIVGSGKIDNINNLKRECESADCIICADGGAVSVDKADIVPDIIIGDLDSIKSSILNKFITLNVEFKRYPEKKDFTDMELCLDYALSICASEVTIMGGTGSRLDHTLANIFLLYFLLEKNIKGKIIDDNNEVYIINDVIELKQDEKEYVSIIPISNIVYGISTNGFEYETNKLNLKFGSARGVSNKLKKYTGKIQIDNGLCLIIKSKD